MTLDEQFHDLVAGHTPAIQDLAHAARDLVLSVQPDAHQEVHMSWGGYLLFKRVADTGNTVCYLTAHKQHVSIGLSQGADLPDPGNLLEGTGKHSRRIKLKSPDELQKPEVRALLQAAWDQQPEAGVLQDALARVRQFSATLPETRESVSHGHPTFWAGKKTFAVFGLYAPSIAFKANLHLHEELDGDPRFSPTPYMAKGGWLSLRIDADTDWDLAKNLLVHSYRQVATPKLLRALEQAQTG